MCGINAGVHACVRAHTRTRTRTLTLSGMEGNSSEDAILNMAVMGLPTSYQGGRPLSISITVHPMDQMSAFRPCPEERSKVSHKACARGGCQDKGHR